MGQNAVVFTGSCMEVLVLMVQGIVVHWYNAISHGHFVKVSGTATVYNQHYHHDDHSASHKAHRCY